MHDWSAEARAALGGGHTVASRVDVLHAGRVVYQLDAVGGSVGMDAYRPVLANLSCSLIDPTGNLTRGDVEDLLDPYECEVQPWRGVQLTSTTLASTLSPNAGFGLQGFGTSGFGGVEATLTAVLSHRTELASLGVFGLTGRRVSDTPDGLAITIDGQDRAMNYQTPMASALAIPGGTPVEDAIIRLLAAANPGLSVLAMSTGYTCGPLLYPPDSDVWREAQDLAASVGARLFHDRTGQCVLAPAGSSSRTPVAEYAEGGGLLLSVDRAEDSDTIKNVVVAESPNGLVRAVAEDDDPTSPTFAGGRYGRRVLTISNQHFGSVQQAQQAAAARLVYELGRSETVTFTAVPDPGLDVEDIVSVHRPRAGLNHRALAVATLTVPLGAEETMTVGCRKSVLAQGGAVLEPIGDAL